LLVHTEKRSGLGGNEHAVSGNREDPRHHNNQSAQLIRTRRRRLTTSKTAFNGASTPKDMKREGGAMRPTSGITGSTDAPVGANAYSELQGRRDELAALAELQAALRRVATLVARAASPAEVFSVVAEEMARCLKVANAEVCRYRGNGAGIVAVGSFAETGVPDIPPGESLMCEGENVSGRVWHTGRPARMDSYEHAAGSIAARMRDLGIRSRVGAPIIVDDRVWGLAVVGSRRLEPLPPETEERVGEFADLVATAIAAATSRAALIDSRRRIVAAADETRRRLERNLHDGAQQRAVWLGLQLRTAEELVPSELGALRDLLCLIGTGLTELCEELREISHGMHPAIVSTGGLVPALKSLARRSPIPIGLEVAVPRRLPEVVEVAAYYVVAEALTNAAKHAQASELAVTADADEEVLQLTVRDDGVGGATAGKGSGLIGLIDRVEALGGQLIISSPVGGGTSLRAKLPLRHE
jgi:signal transduction histidine kinase